MGGWHQAVGVCKNECKAVQQACGKSLKGKEEAIVSLLKDASGLAQLQNEVCEKACKKKKNSELEGWTDEEFTEDKERDKEDAVNTLMETMKGIPGMENMHAYRPGEL